MFLDHNDMDTVTISEPMSSETNSLPGTCFLRLSLNNTNRNWVASFVFLWIYMGLVMFRITNTNEENNVSVAFPTLRTNVFTEICGFITHTLRKCFSLALRTKRIPHKAQFIFFSLSYRRVWQQKIFIYPQGQKNIHSTDDYCWLWGHSWSVDNRDWRVRI